MMTKKKVVEQAQEWPDFAVGDKVIWRGFELTVHEVKDGVYSAHSLIHHVTTDDPAKQFTPA
jgi:hypothetical protein